MSELIISHHAYDRSVTRSNINPQDLAKIVSQILKKGKLPSECSYQVSKQANRALHGAWYSHPNSFIRVFDNQIWVMANNGSSLVITTVLPIVGA